MKQLSLFALADPIAKMLGSWSVELTTYSILLRLVTVIILTSIIGCERSSKRHSAGLRTFVLVSFSSCVAMILDLYLMQEYRIGLPLLSTATIISAAMLSGNSIVFSSRSQIKGLTTSAALWFCGFLGFVIGAGQYTLSIIVYVLFLCILTWFPSIEVYLNNRSNHFEIHLELKNSNYLRDFVTVSRQLGLRIDDIEANQAYVGSGLSVYTITFTIFSAELKKYKTHREIIPGTEFAGLHLSHRGTALSGLCRKKVPHVKKYVFDMGNVLFGLTRSCLWTAIPSPARTAG